MDIGWRGISLIVIATIIVTVLLLVYWYSQAPKPPVKVKMTRTAYRGNSGAWEPQSDQVPDVTAAFLSRAKALAVSAVIAAKLRPAAQAAASAAGVPTWVADMCGDALDVAIGADYSNPRVVEVLDSDSEDLLRDETPNLSRYINKPHSVHEECRSFGTVLPEYAPRGSPLVQSARTKIEDDIAGSLESLLKEYGGGEQVRVQRNVEIGDNVYPVVYQDDQTSIAIVVKDPRMSTFPNIMHRSRAEFEQYVNKLKTEKSALRYKYRFHLIRIDPMGNIRGNILSALERCWRQKI